jgi:hypothetical protein
MFSFLKSLSTIHEVLICFKLDMIKCIEKRGRYLQIRSMILIELSKHMNQDLLSKFHSKSEDFLYFKPWGLPA